MRTRSKARLLFGGGDPGHPPLASAISGKNGQDVDWVYGQLTYEHTVGGNSDFDPGNIDISFLDSNQQYRSGGIHLHTDDGLIHLDNFNPFSFMPLGAIGHLFVDFLGGHINSDVPFAR